MSPHSNISSFSYDVDQHGLGDRISLTDHQGMASLEEEIQCFSIVSVFNCPFYALRHYWLTLGYSKAQESFRQFARVDSGFLAWDFWLKDQDDSGSSFALLYCSVPLYGTSYLLSPVNGGKNRLLSTVASKLMQYPPSRVDRKYQS